MSEPATNTEALREEMIHVFARAKMPSSPATATEILGLIQDRDSTAEQFANVIQTDPGLASRLLRMANSSAYSQRSRVSSVQRAVTIIGLRKLRIMVLGLELVGHLERLGGCPFDLRFFWQQALVRACLAREVARPVVPELAEEAFLVGLLQDCGVIVLVQTLGMPYAMLVEELGNSPTAFHAEEKQRFPYDHAAAVGVLADMWKFPETIAQPLSEHHTVPRGTPLTDVDKLSAVSALVGCLGLVGSNASTAEANYVSKRICELLRLDDAFLETAFAAAAAVYEETAEMFGDSVSQEYDPAELLQEANQQLLVETDNLQQAVDVVSAERDRLMSEQVSLENALGMYREQAARDPLTSVFNRGALTDATVELIARAEADGELLTVMFLDIDDFKRLNDCHGHAVGDRVLESVADEAARLAVNDGIVGRYGGEEFVVVIANQTAEQGEQAAQRLVEAIAQRQMEGLGLEGPVTCSLGAVICTIDGPVSAEALFDVADQHMYEAKRSGKNRACLARLESVRALKVREHPGLTEERASPDELGITSEQSVLPDPETLERVARFLNGRHNDRPAESRKQSRHSWVRPCIVRYLRSHLLEVGEEAGIVRNVSSGGIGLILARPRARGDLLEIMVDRRSERMYLAGQVAYCHRISGVIHDVGVQLVQHAREPIFSDDPVEAVERFEWVRHALSDRQVFAQPRRKSA